MLKNLTLTLVCLFFILNTSSAQEVWSLEKCVLYARQNNINVKRVEISVKNNQLTEKVNKSSRYPNLNAGVNGGYNFGRTINPVSNEFVSSAFGSTNLSLNTGITIFNGGRINKSIEQSGHDIEAAKSDLEQTKNDIGINVATAYLNVLFAKEQLQAAQNRLNLSEQQLNQVDKLIQAGARPQNDRLEILASMARNAQAIITQENAVETGLLNLKNLLQLDPNFDLDIEKPVNVVISASDNPDGLVVNEVYEKAMKNQPFINGDESRLKSAELGEEIAKTQLLPSIGASAGMNTNYANSNNFPSPAFSEQVENNFGQNIGIGLNIPIYNRGQTRTNIERAQLNSLNVALTNKLNKQNLKTNIQTAIANAKAAKRTLAASQTTVDASRAAFENAEKRFQLGAINTFEYATAKNNLDQAEVDLIVAKYDYLFKLKIVDFYLGKPIKLN